MFVEYYKIRGSVIGGQDKRRILQLHHQIALISGKIYKAFDRQVRKANEKPDNVSSDQLLKLMETAMFDIDKIRKVSKFSSKDSFDLSTNRVKEDLIQFTEEYLESFQELSLDYNIKVIFENPNRLDLVRSFRPIELTMMVDNIIDNAGKANARQVKVKVSKRSKSILLSFEDNGNGLSDRYKPDELFFGGVSTTSGSGIGLSHVYQIANDLNGTVSINNNKGKGATVTVSFDVK
jgi:signal transduction histidine kinase